MDGNIFLNGLYRVAKAGANIKNKARAYLLEILGNMSTTWDTLLGKPSEFPPENHTHVLADITDYSPGAGSGDMVKAVYDPTNVAGDAFDYTNFTNTPTIPTSIDQLGPSQTGNNGKFLTTDGTNASWASVSSGTTTKSFWMFPSNLEGRATAATLTQIGANTRVECWQFSGTTPQGVAGTYAIPNDWASGPLTCKLYYCNNGTSTNNWVARFYANGPFTAGTDLNATTLEEYATDTITPSATQYALTIHTHSYAPVPTVAGELRSFLFVRLSADPNDTNTGSMNLIAIEFTYTAYA